MREPIIGIDALARYPRPDRVAVDADLREQAAKSQRKIIVLDDDPTGVQTVHGVYVYTDWSLANIRDGFSRPEKLFFVLTNSRSFTAAQTARVHRQIGSRIATAAEECGQEYLIVSRGDSTLRGHYPLETECLRAAVEETLGQEIDGEIFCPYFQEGGRFTLEDIHYVRYGDTLVPCGQTEFARDKTFGYSSSDLREYIAEKTQGRFRADQVISIDLESLRARDYASVERRLMAVTGFNKVIVNAADDADVKAFAVALYRAMDRGKRFCVRCAASLVKAIGAISDRPLLTAGELFEAPQKNGGILAVGSHTQKTTAQLERLRRLENIEFLELNSDLVLQGNALWQERDRVAELASRCIAAGKTVCVSTRRTVLSLPDDTPEKALLRSVRISTALQSCVGRLSSAPAFVVAKGGITSADVGVKALAVRRALVLGQIAPGVPVWRTGRESRFPGIPYVIFPGNVGEPDTLEQVTRILLAHP